MTDYSLLRNKVYLILLANYNQKKIPSFIELGKLTDLTRQTASNKVKELVEKGLISLDDNNIVTVLNPLNINVADLRSYLEMAQSFNPQELKECLFGLSSETIKNQAKELKMSRTSLYLDDNGVVYGIVSEGKIKYIGTSAHFEYRIQQHIKKRPFLKPSDFVILAENKSFNIEKELIHLLEPEWNIMSK